MDTSEDFLKKFKEGDEAIFMEVFKTYRDAIFSHCFNILKDEAQAEDVTILSFEKLWGQKDKLNDHKEAKNFLYFVSKNKCFDIIRTRQTEEKKHKAYHSLQEQPENTKETEIIFSELMSSIYKEIEHLPKKMREVFILRYYAGKTVEEVSELMHLEKRTVYNQTAYAILKLRKQLTLSP